MTIRCGALAGLLLCLAAPEALACTVIIPPPRPGETVLQAGIRAERVEQQGLRANATHVYLARVEFGRNDRPRFVSLAAVEGGMPPRRIDNRSTTNCEFATPLPGETRLVFIRVTRPQDAPWRPWTWGRAEVLGSRLPHQIVDAGVVGALGRAVQSKGRR